MEDDRQGAGVQPQSAAHVVESQGVGQLRVEKTDDMAPGKKRAALFLHGVLPGQFRCQMVKNEIPELAEE
jgi:hypothetical protein